MDIDRLAVPGATIALQMAWGDRPVCTAMFDAEGVAAQLAAMERQYRIEPGHRDSPEVHAHVQRTGLILLRDGGSAPGDDWVPAAGLTLLWCGLHHPGLGERNVREAGRLLRKKGAATVAFEIRDGGLWFEIFDIPLQRGLDGPRAAP